MAVCAGDGADPVLICAVPPDGVQASFCVHPEPGRWTAGGFVSSCPIKKGSCIQSNLNLYTLYTASLAFPRQVRFSPLAAINASPLGASEAHSPNAWRQSLQLRNSFRHSNCLLSPPPPPPPPPSLSRYPAEQIVPHNPEAAVALLPRRSRSSMWCSARLPETVPEMISCPNESMDMLDT